MIKVQKRGVCRGPQENEIIIKE